MQKLFSRLVPIVALLGATFQSCSDDDKTLSYNYEPPTLSVKVDDLQRTQADFTIQSAQASDYAYMIVEKGEEVNITDAEYLFQNGETGLLEGGTATVSSLDVEGSKEYTLCAAVRRINPYVYSEVKTVDLSTDLPYTKLLTLNRIGYTDFSYHVEIPENVEKVKHLIVRKNDYEGVKSILAGLGDVTEDLYLKVFGHLLTNSADFVNDKYVKDGSGIGTDVHIHSDNTFLVMAGVVDENGEIDKDQFEVEEFNTRKTETTPFDVNVAVETTSTSAKISLTPDPEITHYRVLIEKKTEFDFWRREGEQQVRYTIIGHWDDATNYVRRDYTGDQLLSSSGLIPNNQYIVGIVAFDAQGRERYKEVEFVTGEPTGPAPTLVVTETAPTTATMWNSRAFNVKATNAVEVRYGFWLKSQVDDVLSSGASMGTIIESNGTLVSDQQLAAISSDEGLTFETNDLQPETSYVFGVYARTDEYVSAVEYRTFTTEEMPQIGGAVRKNMPGNYLAKTTDKDGNEVSFPVTITTGVNDATTTEYGSLNRLVALGFGPSDQFPYTGPESITSGDPNSAYGPKWFIEFTEDGIRVPACNKAWSMGTINDNVTYMTGYGNRTAANGRVVEYSNDEQTFTVEVSDDGNTITIKGELYGTFAGTDVYMHPAMYYPGQGWFASNTYLFQCGSDIVLTRQTTTSARSRVHNSIKLPKITNVTIGGMAQEKAYRTDISRRLKQ